MFRSPFLRSGTVISDQGYKVTLRTRYSLQYDEQGISASINYDAVYPELDLLTLSLVAFCGNRLLELDSQTVERVFSNVSAALQWKGYHVRLVGSR